MSTKTMLQGAEGGVLAPNKDAVVLSDLCQMGCQRDSCKGSLCCTQHLEVHVWG